ncbi:MFS transporter [Caldifermentibacillus hisashii]|uniref:MFS transporter n=1 Tax=Bacillaceae TaxID=186817 RepID=UPI0022E40B42|nr:MFS transporter [Caldibacillus thermoamylovorans]
MNHYKKNLVLFGTYSVLTSVLYIDAIFALFAFENGLSITQLMLIGTISGITVILTEIPTGIISDKYSRKISFLISAILRLISIILYIFGSFYIGSVFMALGAVFSSGTDSAYLYDLLKKYNQENEFQEIDGRIRSYTFYYMGFVAVISGFLYDLNIYIPFFATIGTFVIAIVITIFLEDDKTISKSNKSKGHFEILKLSITMLKTPKIFDVTFLFVFIMSIIQIIKGYDQPFMYEIELSSTQFGIVFFVLSAIAGFFSKRSKRITLKLKNHSTNTLVLGLGILTLSLFFINNLWGIIILITLSIIRGISGPYFYTKLNNNIPSENRATLISCASLLVNLVMAVMSPLTGLIADNFGLKFTYLFISCIVFSYFLITKFSFYKRKEKFENNIVRDINEK